ncbi:MAG: c-type cytochrome [Gemmobacter sp.]
MTGICRTGSHFTGIKGVMDAAGAAPEALMTVLRDVNHPYTPEMITDAEMLRVARFLGAGLVDMRTLIDDESRKVTAGVGDTERGRAIFRTTCAPCRGFDGRALDWGADGEHNFVGIEAAELPDEVMNTISNAHPGAAMIHLRAFSVDDRISVKDYVAGLPTGIEN